ncbi:MAG: thiamine diphosphokinase [Oscillospiraceae bacterium]|jgi:thiamine pyrophosphokinase|nr:thiamine diphosphokinase [Oscillospiraceae bacterium]
MDGKTCFVMAAGEYFTREIRPYKGDLIIAADAGYNTAKNLGLKPDLVVGDFDSMKVVPELENIVRLNPVKDVTDTFEALRIGLAKGYKKFYIYGGTGGLYSHTMANIQSLAMLAKNGARGYLFGKEEVFTVIHNGKAEFDASASGYISVFSLESESSGVYETGLKYKLENYTMKNDDPIGVSNEFAGHDSCVSVNNGTLLIVYSMIAHSANLA